MINKQAFNFHIPVMGTGYTLSTPLRVAHLGISSVVSIVDDFLMEKMRKKHCEQHEMEYTPISTAQKDYRAERITSFLNTIDKMVKKNFENFKHNIQNKTQVFEEYIDTLPNFSELKIALVERLQNSDMLKDAKSFLLKEMKAGSVDVNIMTKVDKQNYYKGKPLPTEYNDAHAALRGFANSNLQGALVLSAGMNPRLYAYLTTFDDFYPDADGNIKKRIVLKVSDYRSATIQGQYLAKRGIWVSEFRIESGLNCGGHAFATNGMLMGPILQMFKDNREALKNNMFDTLCHALREQNKVTPRHTLPLNITAQGGIGTADEHQFLSDYYAIDSVGWGSPFLLAPDVCDVDANMLQRLTEAKEDDLYLSAASPLGVPFNNLKDPINNNRNTEGVACTKRLMQSNTEFTKRPICTASKLYFKHKKSALQKADMPKNERQEALDLMYQKTCLCQGLGQTATIANGIEEKYSHTPAICPGPNLAYFGQKTNLKQMIAHIYNHLQLCDKVNRPHVFIKELGMYIDYLKKEIQRDLKSPKIVKANAKFKSNLLEGIAYYKTLHQHAFESFSYLSESFLSSLHRMEKELKAL